MQSQMAEQRQHMLMAQCQDLSHMSVQLSHECKAIEAQIAKIEMSISEQCGQDTEIDKMRSEQLQQMRAELDMRLQMIKRKGQDVDAHSNEMKAKIDESSQRLTDLKTRIKGLNADIAALN